MHTVRSGLGWLCLRVAARMSPMGATPGAFRMTSCLAPKGSAYSCVCVCACVCMCVHACVTKTHLQTDQDSSANWPHSSWMGQRLLHCTLRCDLSMNSDQSDIRCIGSQAFHLKSRHLLLNGRAVARTCKGTKQWCAHEAARLTRLWYMATVHSPLLATSTSGSHWSPPNVEDLLGATQRVSLRGS